MLKSVSKVLRNQRNIARYLNNEHSQILVQHRSTLVDNINKIYDLRTTSKRTTTEWKTILSTAEKVVGYPTSFLNLRYLISDEVANFASLLRKLMLTNHPLIDMAKHIVNEPNRYTQMIGLIALLVSKAAGVSTKTHMASDISDGIHQTQRALAEISEMINMAFIIHRGIVDLKSVEQSQYDDINNGNKIAVLCGDYLLAKACTNLAKLRNTEVVEIMSQVIADLSQIVFVEVKTEVKSKSESHMNCWYERTYRQSSSLLANTCKSSLLLVNHTKQLQFNVWNFANNIDLVHKIWLELHQFHKHQDITKPHTLLNAICLDNYRIDNAENNNDVEQVQNAIAKSVKIFEKHYDLAMDNLNSIRSETTNEDAMESLKSILNLMKASVVS